MWVSSKEAAEILGIKYDALQKATRRSEKFGKKFCTIKSHICNFSYTDGIGRGGKILRIWLDDEIVAVYNANLRGKESLKAELESFTEASECDESFTQTPADTEHFAGFKGKTEEFRSEIQPADVHALKDYESVFERSTLGKKAISTAIKSIGSLSFMQINVALGVADVSLKTSKAGVFEGSGLLCSRS